MLELTCLILLTNAITAFLREYYIYALIFFILTATSVINHTTHHPLANRIDLLAVWSVALCGAYHFVKYMTWERWYMVPLILFFFSGTVVLYYYGLANQQYCFDPDPILAQMYHGYLHIVGSIAHHLIIFQ